MPDTVDDIVTGIKDLLGIQSLQRGKQELSGKDWAIVFRVFSLVGWFFVLIGFFITLMVIALVSLLRIELSIGAVGNAISFVALISFLFLVFSSLVSSPLDEMAGKSKQANLKELNVSPKFGYIIGILSIIFALYIRVVIIWIPVFIEVNPSRLVGRFLGIVIFDMIYFGLFLFGLGILGFVYHSDKTNPTSPNMQN